MRFIFLSFFLLMVAFPLQAATPEMQTVETNQPFGTYLQKLKTSIAHHKMGIVAEACATCGAKKIGVTIAGNRVIMIFHPRFAVRMLKASIEAGVEAPLRLYVTENKDGTARLSYQKPSAVFGVYENAALDEMAAELDTIFEQIIEDSL